MREIMKKKGEEIRQNTVKEFKKIYKYTTNKTKEYPPRNLNALDVNEE